MSTPCSGVAMEEARWKSAPAQKDDPSLRKMRAQQFLYLLGVFAVVSSKVMSCRVIIIWPVRAFLTGGREGGREGKTRMSYAHNHASKHALPNLTCSWDD